MEALPNVWDSLFFLVLLEMIFLFNKWMNSSEANFQKNG